MISSIIYLTGMSGVGKSTYGKYLAKELKYDFKDSDIVITNAQKLSVKEIFEKNGEDYFRDLEHEALINLSKQKNIVIATGGGMPMFERNYEIMKNTGTTVYIIRPPEDIWQDLDTKNRPLLKKADPQEGWNNYLTLYNKRAPIYATRCDFTVSGSWSEIQQQLIKLFKNDY